MNKEEILGAFSLVNNPIVLSEEEVKDVQKAIKELQQENQELKLELSGYRQAILEDKDMLGLKEENDKLKKQLEEYKEQVHKGLYNVCLPYKTGYNKAIKDKEIQQKEFIKWLEDYLNLFDNMDIDEQISYDTIEEILRKYKEIIGDDK